MLRLTQNMLIIKNGLKVHSNVKERRARFNAILKEISHIHVVNDSKIKHVHSITSQENAW